MSKKDKTLSSILRDPEQRRAWVIYQLSLKDRCLADVGRDLGVTRTAVYRAFDKPYPKMEQAIAKELGMLACDLFPDRYTHGIPNRVMGRPKTKTDGDNHGTEISSN